MQASAGSFVALPFLLMACSKGETPVAPQAMKLQAMKVGLLTPGSVNDGGWNAIAYEGASRRFTKKFRAEITQSGDKNAGEFEEGFRSYGSRGFDLAFGHGFEFQDAALQSGKAVPEDNLHHDFRQLGGGERLADGVRNWSRQPTCLG